MNFIKNCIKSGIGAGIALGLYGATVMITLFGMIFVSSLVSISLAGGAIFGIFFALAHLRRTPSLASNMLSGFAFVAAACMLSIAAGSFAGFSPVAIIFMAVLALMIGGCSYLATTD